MSDYSLLRLGRQNALGNGLQHCYQLMVTLNLSQLQCRDSWEEMFSSADAGCAGGYCTIKTPFCTPLTSGPFAQLAPQKFLPAGVTRPLQGPLNFVACPSSRRGVRSSQASKTRIAMQWPSRQQCNAQTTVKRFEHVKPGRLISGQLPRQPMLLIPG